jgi:hypothetical protein
MQKSREEERFDLDLHDSTRGYTSAIVSDSNTVIVG